MRLTTAMLVTCALIAAAHAALADDVRVVQRDKRFSATKVTVKSGDLTQKQADAIKSRVAGNSGQSCAGLRGIPGAGRLAGPGSVSRGRP